VLHLTRALIALRAAEPALRRAPVRFVEAGDDVLAYDRGSLRVILNFSDREHPLSGVDPVLATGPLDGDRLGPWQGVVVRRRGG
jgi:hypothetical protein